MADTKTATIEKYFRKSSAKRKAQAPEVSPKKAKMEPSIPVHKPMSFDFVEISVRATQLFFSDRKQMLCRCVLSRDRLTFHFPLSLSLTLVLKLKDVTKVDTTSSFIDVGLHITSFRAASYLQRTIFSLRATQIKETCKLGVRLSGEESCEKRGDFVANLSQLVFSLHGPDTSHTLNKNNNNKKINNNNNNNNIINLNLINANKHKIHHKHGIMNDSLSMLAAYEEDGEGDDEDEEEEVEEEDDENKKEKNKDCEDEEDDENKKEKNKDNEDEEDEEDDENKKDKEDKKEKEEVKEGNGKEEEDGGGIYLWEARKSSSVCREITIINYDEDEVKSDDNDDVNKDNDDVNKDKDDVDKDKNEGNKDKKEINDNEDEVNDNKDEVNDDKDEIKKDNKECNSNKEEEEVKIVRSEGDVLNKDEDDDDDGDIEISCHVTCKEARSRSARYHSNSLYIPDASSTTPHSDPQKLFTYPPNTSAGSITLTTDDVTCLDERQYLNDVCIDFYLKYLWTEVLDEQERQRTHIFSSFFYSHLTNGHLGKKSGTPEQRYNRVRNWTRRFDLFSKDFIVIPLNQNYHWFLAIICFPSMCTDPSFVPKVKKKDKTIKTTNQVIKHPVILIFDSLNGGQARWDISTTLREYLQLEWNHKRHSSQGECLFSKRSMKGCVPRCPQQDNLYDCGPYLLLFVRSFFKTPVEDFTPPVKGLMKWFSKPQAACFRGAFKRLVQAKAAQSRPEVL